MILKSVFLLILVSRTCLFEWKILEEREVEDIFFF